MQSLHFSRWLLNPWHAVAAMSVDSESVFKARCDEIKISQATYDALKAKGWSTFGSYAFSVSTNPGQITDDDFDNKVAVPILGSATEAESALLRRLLFESYTLTATELKRKADNSESDGPKKLPVQEIAFRFSALEKNWPPWRLRAFWNQATPSSTAWHSAQMMDAWDTLNGQNAQAEVRSSTTWKNRTVWRFGKPTRQAP